MTSDKKGEGGRGGSRNTPNLRENSIYFADKDVGAGRWSKNLVDVTYGSPLTLAGFHHRPRPPPT